MSRSQKADGRPVFLTNFKRPQIPGHDSEGVLGPTRRGVLSQNVNGSKHRNNNSVPKTLLIDPYMQKARVLIL